MKIKIKCILASLFIICILSNLGWAQNEAPGDKLLTPIHPDASGGRGHLILIPELAAATLDGGRVTIPFDLKNDSDRTVEILCTGQLIDGLAIVDQAGEKRFIQDLHGSLSHFQKSGRVFLITLKPGETTPGFSSVYRVETLRNVTGRKVFGVLSGSIGDQMFRSYSAPFLIPPALTTLPFNDLGTQTYLSIIPDLTKADFSGGTGWIPITVTNTSNQDIIVANDEIRFYIAGNETKRVALLRDERWEYLKTSTPVLKPGESCGITGRDYITLRFLEDDGYKPGDKIIAVVGGRIPGTNNIFECYSAPFELPPLPKGEPPAGKKK
jgi:hypothetical protein